MKREKMWQKIVPYKKIETASMNPERLYNTIKL